MKLFLKPRDLLPGGNGDVFPTTNSPAIMFWRIGRGDFVGMGCTPFDPDNNRIQKLDHAKVGPD